MTDAELDQCRHDGALLFSLVSNKVKLKRAGREWKGCCPFHDDRTPSFTVYEDGHFHCYGCGKHGTVFDFVMLRDSVDFHAATERVANEIGAAPSRAKPKPKANGADHNARPKPWENVGIAYDYRDANGVLIAQNVRMKAGFPKRFMQRRPTGRSLPNGEPIWKWSTKDLTIPLYRLSELRAAPADRAVFLSEGEKDADRLAAAGLIATTNIAGAASWHDRHNGEFAGCHVVILEDNDDAGRKRSARIAPGLIGIAASVRVLALPGLPPKGDVSDWLDAGNTIETLIQLARETPAYEPPPPPSPDDGLGDGPPSDGEVPPQGPVPGDDAGAEASEAEAEAQIDAVPPDDVLNAINELGPGLTLKMLVAVFNKRFAVAYEGGKTAVIWSTFDPLLHRDRIERTSFEEFKKQFSNRRLTVTIPGRKPPSVTKSFGEWWLADPYRRQYLGGVVFSPGATPIPHTFNLWRGWAVEPAPGDWSLMSDHIHTIICGGRSEVSSYVIRWLAYMVQHPSEQGEVAIVVRGLKGVGKTIFGKWLPRLCGQHGLHIHNPIHLTGRFTGHLRDVIFVLADEAFFAGDKEHERILKGIITDDQVLIEPKYRTPTLAANMMHLMMLSNEDWVVPATHDERRYAMMQAAPDRIGDFAYFATLDAQMANGGLAAMLHDLQTMDLGDFHPRRDAPDTPELAEQKAHSMDSVHRWWMAVLSRGFVWKSRYGQGEFLAWDEFVTTELLTRSYAQWCQENRVTYPAHRAVLGKRLAAIYPPGRPRGEYPVYEADSIERDNPQPVVRLPNQMGYKVGALDNARVLFAKAMGLKDETSEWDVPVT